MTPEPLQVRRERLVRDVGVKAERHWFVQRLRERAKSWRWQAETIADQSYDRALVYNSVAAEIEALIAERER